MSPTPIPHAHRHRHDQAHGHREAMTPPFSLLRLSALERIGAAFILVLLLWGAVFWAAS